MHYHFSSFHEYAHHLALVLVFFFCSMVLGATQESNKGLILVKYKIIHIYDTTKPDTPGEEVMQLRVSKTVSEFSSYEFETEYQKYDKARYAIRQSNGIVLNGSNYPANYVKKSQVMQYNYFSGGKSYWVHNSVYQFYMGYAFDMPETKWTITDEKKVIGNVSCQKATGWVKGRLYDVWFAPSLPFSTGPWKLQGLPGLILDAYDQKKQVQFRFVSIENMEDQKRIIGLPPKTLLTSMEKFDAWMATIKKNPFAMATLVLAGSDDVADRFLKDNADLIAKQKLENAQKQSITVNNPVELKQ
jgi:GLPGLI family protein